MESQKQERYKVKAGEFTFVGSSAWIAERDMLDAIGNLEADLKVVRHELESLGYVNDVRVRNLAQYADNLRAAAARHLALVQVDASQQEKA